MKQSVNLKGKDGLDLLHRISTIDLKRAKLNEKILGLILNPQGKIRSAFQITPRSAELAEIEFEDNFLEIVDQITFGEKYTIEKTAAPSDDVISEHDRILKLIPKFGAEFFADETTNPLEVNLRSSVHDDKGCYPGQEVIEKIISLGSPPKRLCLLEGKLENVKLPAKLFGENGSDAGMLTSYANGVGLGIIKRTFLKENEKLFLGTEPLTLRKISET
jgi:folate-binding protein YgfZ